MISESKNNKLIFFCSSGSVVITRIHCVIHISVDLERLAIIKLSTRSKKKQNPQTIKL